MKKKKSYDLILYAMKFTVGQLIIAYLFIGSIYANTINGQNVLDQTISVNFQNKEISKVLSQINTQTGVKFVYSSKAIKADRKLTASAKDEKLGDFMVQHLKPLGISFGVVENKVLLYSSEDIASNNKIISQVSEFALNLDDKIITGTVLDNNGNPLAGATVYVKGNNKILTSTDVSGSFKLKIPEQSTTIVIEYVGFNSVEVNVKAGGPIIAKLNVTEKQIDEVVVIGYGTQSKRNVSSSISSVKSEQIKQVPIMSPEQALIGRAPGVQVTQSNGAPGGSVQVQIRGVNSTSATGNNPLYVIDGIPLFDYSADLVPGGGGAGTPERNGTSPLATLNPNDIESMDILKDASATAIYGSRAANGVVVITTKSGKAGKTVFNFDTYYGIQKIQKKWDLSNAIEGMLTRNEALLNTRTDWTRNINAEFFNPFAFASSNSYKNNDWQDALFTKAPMKQASLSASGGTDKVRFMLSGDYFNQEGIFRNTYMERISSRFNLDVKATEKLTLGFRSTVSNQKGNNVTDNNPFQGNVIGALLEPQFNQAFYADGTYFAPPYTASVINQRNYVFEADNFLRPTQRFRFNGNAFGEYEIVKGLKFKSMIGIDFTSSNQKIINPAIPRGPAYIINGPDLGPSGTSKAYSQNFRSYNWVADQTLTYNRTFNLDHKVEALLGFSAQQVKTYSTTLIGQGSINPQMQLIGTNNGINGGGEGYGEQGLVSLFMRSNYAYKDKYLFTGTIRQDGSSNFGADNRYGVFPSASVGWRISKEKFFEKINFISDLKIRASWGLTGNQNIGSFGFVSRMSSTNTIFGTSVVTGFSPSNLANEGLKWEANEQTDLGLDFSILKGRIQFTADYYVKNAKNLLVGIPIAQFSGFSSQTVNLGTIQNKGFEFSVNAHVLEGVFKWNLSLNLATLENKVLDLGTNSAGGINEFFGYAPFTTNGPANITRAGLPIGSFYGLKTNGIFRTASEISGYPVQVGIVALPGDAKYVDQNKDGIINDLDRVVLGSAFPDFYGGFTNDISYKNFSLNIFSNFVFGQKVFNHTRLMLEDMLDAAGTVNQYYNRFTSTNTNSNLPRLTAGGNSAYNRLNSDRWIEDASFLRIRNITLGYNFPNDLLKKMKIQTLRVYASVNNAFTITKYTGWDPEVNSSGSSVLSNGIDQGGYPVARSFIFGINLKF